MPSYGCGGAATVVVTVRVGGGAGAVVVSATAGGADGGTRLDVVDIGGVEVAVVEVSVVDVSPVPPRVAYTPSAAAAAAITPTADARIGTARDFRWGGAVVASPVRSRVGASGSTAPDFGDVAAASVGADAG